MEEIEKLGGWVYYDYQLDRLTIPQASRPGHAWLRELLGDDLFVNVTGVDLRQPRDQRRRAGTPQRIDPTPRAGLDGTKVSDAGLEHLKGLTQLQWLYLDGTKVSDAGLEHLKGLTQLQRLDLDDTKVSDAGLEHLKGLTQLQKLDLNGTKVSDAGLEHLKGLTQLQSLCLDDTKVSDAGLEHLKGLTQLQQLYLAAPRSATPGWNTSKD